MDAKVSIYERRERGKVRFYLTYTLDGKRHRDLLPIPSAEEKDRHAISEGRALAQAYQVEKAKELRSYLTGQPVVSDMFLTDWLRVVSERAIARQRPDMHRHTWGRTIGDLADIITRWRGDRLLLSRCDRAFVLDFVQYLRHDYGRPLAESTVAKKYAALQFAFKEAVREGLLATSPCDRLSGKEKPHAPASTRAYLTAEELHTLANTPPPSEALRSVYLFSCFTGLRISDIKALQWSAINRSGERWALSIRQQKTQEPLTLPLSATAQSLLPDPSEGLVFPDLSDLPVLNRQLKRWAKAAGIEKRLTLHTARHTFATLCLTQGVDIYTTSKLLGHSSVATTQIYAKIVDEKKVAAVDALDGLI